MAAFLQAREELIHVVDGPFGLLAALLAQNEVLFHSQGGEDITAFRHISQATVGDFESPEAANGLTVKLNGASGIHQAHDGLHSRGSPHPISPKQADDFARFDTQIHTLQYVALAVVGMQIPDIKQRHCSPLPHLSWRRPGRLPAPWRWRECFPAYRRQ